MKKNEKFMAKDLRLAEIKYFNEEAKGIELTEPIGYVILEKLRDDLYANPFDISDFTPVFERLPYSNTTRNGVEYGSKVRLVINKAESGPCYVLTNINLGDCFDREEIEGKDLEDYILKSGYYFPDRKNIAVKRFKKHPIEMFKVLLNDEKQAEKFSDFFEERDYVVYKK